MGKLFYKDLHIFTENQHHLQIMLSVSTEYKNLYMA